MTNPIYQYSRTQTRCEASREAPSRPPGRGPRLRRYLSLRLSELRCGYSVSWKAPAATAIRRPRRRRSLHPVDLLFAPLGDTQRAVLPDTVPRRWCGSSPTSATRNGTDRGRVPPVATQQAPLAVEFDALPAATPTTTSLAYEWDFGDGSPISNSRRRQSLQDSGTYDATLRVTDPDGSTATNPYDRSGHEPPRAID